MMRLTVRPMSLASARIVSGSSPGSITNASRVRRDPTTQQFSWKTPTTTPLTISSFATCMPTPRLALKCIGPFNGEVQRGQRPQRNRDVVLRGAVHLDSGGGADQTRDAPPRPADPLIPSPPSAPLCASALNPLVLPTDDDRCALGA